MTFQLFERNTYTNNYPEVFCTGCAISPSQKPWMAGCEGTKVIIMYKFERVLESLDFCNTFVQLHFTKTNEMKFEFSDCPDRVQAKVLKKV